MRGENLLKTSKNKTKLSAFENKKNKILKKYLNICVDKTPVHHDEAFKIFLK